MTAGEAKKAFDELKAQGTSDDEILGKLYMMFQDDELSIDELEALVHVLGYEFTPDFAAMSPEDQKTKGWKETGEEDAAEGVSDEEVEDAKEYEGGEDESEEESDEESEEEDDEDEEEDEEDDDKKAAKLFGFEK